jgi:hypothetical protein
MFTFLHVYSFSTKFGKLVGLHFFHKHIWSPCKRPCVLKFKFSIRNVKKWTTSQTTQKTRIYFPEFSKGNFSADLLDKQIMEKRFFVFAMKKKSQIYVSSADHKLRIKPFAYLLSGVRKKKDPSRDP